MNIAGHKIDKKAMIIIGGGTLLILLYMYYRSRSASSSSTSTPVTVPDTTGNTGDVTGGGWSTGSEGSNIASDLATLQGAETTDAQNIAGLTTQEQTDANNITGIAAQQAVDEGNTQGKSAARQMQIAINKLTKNVKRDTATIKRQQQEIHGLQSGKRSPTKTTRQRTQAQSKGQKQARASVGHANRAHVPNPPRPPAHTTRRQH